MAAHRLEFIIPTYNRPRHLHHILRTGLALDIPGAYFAVLDDASDLVEDIPELGPANTEQVCRSFGDPRVLHLRNETNLGLAKMLRRYYSGQCQSEFTCLVNPRDEFISGEPIMNALAKLEADPMLSMVVVPLRQKDRKASDRPITFSYDRMSGKEFIAHYVSDSHLQHCGGYSVIRTGAILQNGLPRDLNLRGTGLEDASGIDHEMIFKVARSGDIDFESAAAVRRNVTEGYTEKYPLTFAYCQYQYARRLMIELEPAKFVTAQTRRIYLSFWHMIMLRAYVETLRPNPEMAEQGDSRIRPHIKMPVMLYLLLEMLRHRIPPRREMMMLCLRAISRTIRG